jgi:4-hydroxy-4-methyl-2-oxoglutarate aldolase
MPLPIPATLEAIRQFDTCMIANAIEEFGLRLRNEGFTRPGLRCMTGDRPRVIGFAATCTVRSANPPMSGDSYRDRTDWWTAIDAVPSPRIAVVQDLEPDAGGGVVGEVHSAILKAFDCVAAITNGSVRDLPGVQRLGFPLFAGSVSVSHAYTHMVGFGEPVEIFGLTVASGDLLYADCHGVLSIPLEVVDDLPAKADEIRAREKRILDLCASPGFSQKKLLELIEPRKAL